MLALLAQAVAPVAPAPAPFLADDWQKIVAGLAVLVIGYFLRHLNIFKHTDPVAPAPVPVDPLAVPVPVTVSPDSGPVALFKSMRDAVIHNQVVEQIKAMVVNTMSGPATVKPPDVPTPPKP